MAKQRRKFNLLDIVIIFAALSALSLLLSAMLAMFVLGLTAIIFIVWISLMWDEILAWLSTRKHQKKVK